MNSVPNTVTLRKLAANAFDRSAAAASLPVHRNTLLYRIGRIEAATGLDLQRHDDRELIRLGVMWTDISPVVRSALS
ncbi:MAG TPA: helix-turn-helix domain-containing protein [Streptosporangiaceae bacterium]|nr:helix-turn-helix domain-containing protein [Streptosporangiaceae bacterium]